MEEGPGVFINLARDEERSFPEGCGAGGAVRWERLVRRPATGSSGSALEVGGCVGSDGGLEMAAVWFLCCSGELGGGSSAGGRTAGLDVPSLGLRGLQGLGASGFCFRED